MRRTRLEGINLEREFFRKNLLKSFFFENSSSYPANTDETCIIDLSLFFHQCFLSEIFLVNEINPYLKKSASNSTINA